MAWAYWHLENQTRRLTIRRGHCGGKPRRQPAVAQLWTLGRNRAKNNHTMKKTISLLYAMFATVNCVANAGTNLVTNGDFTSAGFGWSFTAAASGSILSYLAGPPTCAGFGANQGLDDTISRTLSTVPDYSTAYRSSSMLALFTSAETTMETTSTRPLEAVRCFRRRMFRSKISRSMISRSLRIPHLQSSCFQGVMARIILN